MDREHDRRIKNHRRNAYGRRRRRKRRAYQKRVLLLAMTLFLLVVLGEKAWSSPEIYLSDILQETVELRDLSSPNAVLVDADSGEILAGCNAGHRIYPASLTKIMTAVLAIEYTENMDDMITLPWEFFGELYEEQASMAGFEPGEQVRLRDLLYGILLPSGAECCMAYAERIAGSEENFAELMNEKAKELGMKGTHFCNATGLHEADHYSTAEDIAILLRYAIKNETFRAAFTSRSYSTLPSEVHPDGFTFTSTMFRHLEGTEIAGGAILGGKTGYTEEAGLCLASLAEVSGKEYILVTAGADGNHETEPYHILDAVKVYNRIGEMDS